MKKYIGLLFLIPLLLPSCSFESEGIFTDDTTEDYQLYDYYIDEYGNEGIVAYCYNEQSSGRKYTIVISADETLLPWGPMGETIYKSDTISVRGLRTNSFGIAIYQIMKSIGVEKFPAQAWCDIKNHDEDYPRAGSWHLPSFYEYQLIFGTKGSNVNMLNSALISIGGIPFVDDMYWTCSEDYDNYITITDIESDYDKANRAVIISPYLTTHGYKDLWLKKNNYLVRAIKYVYYQY